MIVKNEEEVLARCLKSLGNFPDQLVIVDTGSIDRTIEIAKEFGAEIHHFEWIRDFAKARNYSFSKATCDYVFWLDGDDEIAPEELEKLMTLKSNLTKDMYLMVYDYFQDADGNPKCDLWRERLVKRELGLKWRYPIHECIPMDQRPLETEQVPIRITHKRTEAGFASDLSRNIDILENAVRGDYADDPRVRYYLAKEIHDNRDFERASREYTKFLNMNAGWYEDKLYAQFKLAQCYYEMGCDKQRQVEKFEKQAREAKNSKKREQATRAANRRKKQVSIQHDNARKAAKQAIKSDSQFAEPYYVLGQLAMDEQDHDEAIYWFEKAFRPFPNVLSPIRRDFYTWMPALQLCVCHSNRGDYEQASYYNEQAAKENPQHSSIIHNTKYFAEKLEEKTQRKTPEGDISVKLNLGSGNKRYKDYTSCDLFPGAEVDEVFPLNDIPYEDQTVDAIHSEHSLEHLRHVDARSAIQEWARVLKPGGELHLQIPDLEECCRKYIEAVQNGDRRLQQWYMYTIFGIQKSQADEPDEGQIHYTGFNLAEILDLLKDADFIIDYYGKYDGHSTPSLEIRAVKAIGSIRIGWLGQTCLESPQYRIRTHHIDRWLRSRGYRTEISQKDQKYDTVIADNGTPYRTIQQYKKEGSRVILNLCEDYDTMLSKEEMKVEQRRYEVVDLIVCCSHALAEKLKKYNTVVIEDAVEVDFNLNCTYENKEQLTVGWIGMGGNVVHAERLRPLIEELGYKLVTIHEHDNADVKWDLNTWQQELAKCDMAIAPIDHHKQPSKSNNKLTTYMALGLPTVVSPLDAYKHVVDNGPSNYPFYIAYNDEGWKHCLACLGNVEHRREMGFDAKEKAKEYSLDAIGQKWVDVLIETDWMSDEDWDKLSVSSLERLYEDEDRAEQLVDIIIPTYGKDDYLQACINSIKTCTTDYPYNIIVVDSLKLGLNFSQAVNHGIRQSTASHVCIMNDDVIVSKGWLKPLLEELKDDVGFANPLSNCDKGWLHNYDLKAGEVNLLPGVHKLGEVDPYAIYDFKSPSTKRYKRDWLPLYCTLATKEAIEKIGYLDEEFETGSEDLDYCKRAEKLGIKCAVAEDSFVFHFGGVSRKAHEMEDRSVHQEEDTKNQNRIGFKYNRPLVVIQSGLAYEDWDANTLREKGCGGSELAACMMAENFAKQGYRAVVFAQTGKPKQVINQVEWYDQSEWLNFIDMNHISICVVSRYANYLEDSIRADQLWLWTHDIFAMCSKVGDVDLVQKNYDKLTGIFVLSKWHACFMADYHGISTEKTWVTGNGINLKGSE